MPGSKAKCQYRRRASRSFPAVEALCRRTGAVSYTHLYGFDWDSEWRDDEARESVIGFIGDNLPEDSIREGFERIVEGR